MLTIGSLFSGCGGLDLAVEQATGGRTVWVSDVDPGACAILTHRFPHAPNLGDITAVDWSTVEPIDVLCGGSPCQDVSQAGRRAGMTEGTRSNLWAAMREAIAALKPQLVIWENVDGAHSAAADSSLEPCQGCVGEAGDGGPVLRALGRVLGDLASLGYDAEWVSLRAADVGACHGRRRVFVAAHPRGEHSLERGLAAPGQATDGRSLGEPARRGRAPSLATPTTEPATGNGHARNLGHEVQLLPTPAAGNFNDGEDPDQWEARRQRVKAATGNGNGMGTPLGIAVQQHDRWGRYAAAIARHERMLGRPAPPPTEPGRHGRPRLSPRFEEWMMCLPAGWVTDVPNLTRNEQLRLLGNGVVPPQAIAALRWLLDMSEVAV